LRGMQELNLSRSLSWVKSSFSLSEQIASNRLPSLLRSVIQGDDKTCKMVTRL
jgi:hypothetical protein